jgi:hypothetical protein
VQCTSVGNLPREAQNLKAESIGDRPKSEAMLKEMEQNGTRAKPEFGTVWYHMAGADRDHVSAHEVTIAVPGATQASLGLPEKRRENGVWIMNAGTSTAHIMIPGRRSSEAADDLDQAGLVGAGLTGATTRRQLP